MPTLSLQEQVDQLGRRVTALERVKGVTHRALSFQWLKSLFLPKDSASLSRVIGWAVLTSSILGLLTTYNDQSSVIFLILAGSIGIWLIIQASGLIDPSDSVRALAQEARPSRARAAHAVHESHRANTARTKKLVRLRFSAFIAGVFIAIAIFTYAVTLVIPDLFWQTTLLLFGFSILAIFSLTSHTSRLVRYLLIAGCYVLVLFMPSHFFTLAYTVLLTAVIYLYSLRTEDSVLGVAAIASALYITQGWLAPSNGILSEVTETTRLVIGMGLSILATFPFIGRRRSLDDRDVSRLSLMVGAVGFALTFLTSSLTLLPYSLSIILLVMGFLYLAFSYFSWQYHGRFSYAKYLLTLALLSWLGFFYVTLDVASATLFFFMLGVVVTTVGFTLPSYSARLVGVSIVGFSILNYFTVVMSQTVQYSGPILLRERVWIGLILAVFLLALAQWYRMATLKGSERMLAPGVILGCYSTAFLIVFGIIYLDVPAGAWQTIFWILLAGVALFAARRTKISLLLVLGLGLLVPSVVKLFVVDSLQMDMAPRLLLFIAVSVVLLLFGLSTPRYKKLHAE